jgi:hypothetical protein
MKTNKIEKFNQIKFIQKICALGERQLEKETEAFKIIEEELRNRNIVLELQKYMTYIPKYTKWKLLADGKKIESLPCGFVSGKIESNFSLISSLTSSQNFFYNSNINFNPASKSISRSNHYFAPSLAIKFSDILRVGKAKKIKGEIKVEKTKHESINILVGNFKNPKNLIFSHYDSIGTGASDNASGVALSLDLIINNPELLNDNLFVISGNEELSYDETIYWGHGYRVFENKYPKLIKDAKSILILDSFGFGKPVKYTDTKITVLGFPIKQIKKYANKIIMISGELKTLMNFYHTNDDKPELIKEKYMKETKKLVLDLFCGQR